MERVEVKVEQLKKITWAVYVLYAASVLVGITGLIGVIVAYIKRKDAEGTIYYSHLQWLIKTFWWTLGLTILAFVTFFFGIGWFIGIGAGIWFIYRVVKGWLKLMEGKAVE